MMPAWNAGPVPGTALPGPSLSILITAAAVRAIFLTVGLPRLPEKNLQNADADCSTSKNKGTPYSICYLTTAHEPAISSVFRSLSAVMVDGDYGLAVILISCRQIHGCPIAAPDERSRGGGLFRRQGGFDHIHGVFNPARLSCLGVFQPHLLLSLFCGECMREKTFHKPCLTAYFPLGSCLSELPISFVTSAIRSRTDLPLAVVALALTVSSSCQACRASELRPRS